MADLRLQKLPDRSPMKLTIAVSPELHRTLSEYADVYEAAYGQRESIADLVPYMVANFLDSDRAFHRRRREN